MAGFQCHERASRIPRLISLYCPLLQALDRVEYWGVLGDRSTWQAMPAGLLERFCAYVAGEGQSCPATNRPPAFQKEEEAAALVDCAASLSGAEQEADAMGSARMVLNPAGRGRQEARKGQGGARYSSNGCGMDCSVPRKPVAVPVLVSASARRGHRQR